MQEQVIAHLARDPKLATILPLIAFPDSGANTDDGYFGLLESITSQQLSVKAADTIFKSFLPLMVKSLISLCLISRDVMLSQNYCKIGDY